ncbi:MAG TPA: DHA2 family efflux MFS transporter permease subunit [Dongiaceae bacterium]|jgi:DHA2 family multidrug resistance protein|nr:DHA2 family efflux MFS transporter permease subunit [Dongiaceae bacterium]
MTMNAMTGAQVPRERVPIKIWLGFGAMCLGMFMAILDIQVVATSLPDIRAALNVDADQMSWIQTAYLIAEIIAIPLTGFLTRVLSMRGLFVIALSGFIVASIGCAGSGSLAVLIGWRVLQGFSGGVLIPTVFSAVFLLFPQHRQDVATTIGGALAVLAPTVGPIVGGWITDTYSWHWLFLINVAPGIVATVAAASLLPRERSDLRFVRKLDLASLILMALALAALEILLKEAPQRGWTSALALVLFTACGTASAAFLYRTLRAALPVVDLRILRDREFALGCWLSFALGFGLYGSVYLMPVFLGLVRLHSAFEIGQVMLVTGIAQLLTAPIAVQVERRCDPKLLSALGFAMFGIGLALSYYQTWETDFDQMLWPQVIRGVAIMFCLLPPTRIALGHLAADRVPNASGLFNLMRNLGGAIGIALIDTVMWVRAPEHVERIVQKLLAGDRATAIFVGLPTDRFTGRPLGPVEADIQELARPLVERAGLVSAINEAWAMMAIAMALALIAIVASLGRKRGG